MGHGGLDTFPPWLLCRELSHWLPPPPGLAAVTGDNHPWRGGPGRGLRQIEWQVFLDGIKRSAHFATFGGSVATRIFKSSTC